MVLKAPSTPTLVEISRLRGLPELSTPRREWRADDRRGWIVGSMGLILHTADGGASWHMQLTPMSDSLRSIRMTPGGASGFAAGDRGLLLRTDDGGASWARQVSLHPEDERAAVERETAGS